MPLRDGGWRLDDTTHPSRRSMAPSDVRLTTRYEPDTSERRSGPSIHEAGHAIYEAGMPDASAPQPGRPAAARSACTSRRAASGRTGWAAAGRSRVGLLADPREHFPEAFGRVDAEALYRAANVVRRSLIRVEADEVTYNLHIAIRFELELALFEESLTRRRPARGLERALQRVPRPRRARRRRRRPPGRRTGRAGAFGYFPTYSLGNVIAAQLWNAAQRGPSGPRAQLAAGELEPLRGWLARTSTASPGKLTRPRRSSAPPAARSTRPAAGPPPRAQVLGELYGLD